MNDLNLINIESLPGPNDITRLQTDNGIIILHRENFSSQSVVISGYLKTGGIHDPDNKYGLANFTTSTLLRGTSKHSFQEIYEIMESSAISYGIGSTTHLASFGGRCLAEDLPILLDIFTETTMDPSFPEEQIEKKRTQIITNLKLREQNTGSMAYLGFREIVYKGHPYSRSAQGYPETVENISREDIVGFHAKHIQPEGLVIAIVGAVTASTAFHMINQRIGGWKKETVSVYPNIKPVKPLTEIIKHGITIPGKVQTDLVIGSAGPVQSSDDYKVISLGNNILGKFGLMGRVGTVVREEAGLAYYATTSLGGGFGQVPWYASAGVDPENLEEVIDLIINEIGKFVQEPVSDEEINDSKSYFIGGLPFILETNNGVAGALLLLELHQLGLDYYRRYPEIIQSITKEQILDCSRKYLDPNRLCISYAGPKVS